MTIGEKIKYFRTRIGITQAKLAELSGIHPVSIRKYETNKMVPQAPQIDRIAETLGTHVFSSGITHVGGTKFQAKKKVSKRKRAA